VLLVDDQAMVGEAVRRKLATQADIRFHFCADTAKVMETIERVKPTVILQDLVMPGTDGMTLLRQYRQNKDTQNIRSSCFRPRRNRRSRARHSR